jgi:hypothetical protein
MKSASRRSAKRPMGNTALWVGALAALGGAAVATAVVLTSKSANAAPAPPPAPPGPPGPPGPPAPGPTPGDYYSTLDPASQYQVQQVLYAWLVGSYAQNPNVNPCPTVDTTSITSAATLADPNTFAAAVDCYQTAKNVGSVAGVMDVQTYDLLMLGHL